MINKLIFFSILFSNIAFANTNFMKACENPSKSDLDLLKAIKKNMSQVFVPRIYSKTFKSTDCKNMNSFIQNRGSLLLNNANITDLNILSFFPHIKKLTLDNNKITDLSPLSKLINLEILKLGENPIENINPLISLKKLKSLSLYSKVNRYFFIEK